MTPEAFIFQAEIYCVDCGQAIRDRITKAGKAPATPDDERSYDSDQFPKGPFTDGGGESDTPANCAACHKFLHNPLTDAGVKYVLEYLKEYTDDKRGAGDALDEWAEELRDYHLSGEQKDILTAFRAAREEAANGPETTREAGEPQAP